MPATFATKLHVYVELLLDTGVGPLVDPQLVIPATPVTIQEPAPLGADPAPVKVAVKTMVEPRVAVVELATTVALGALV